MEKWIQDFLSQQFLNSDITRLILVDALFALKNHSGKYYKKDIAQYIYQIYSDYPTIALHHPNNKIQNIWYYGVDDIRPILDNALLEWSTYANNDSLTYNEHFVFFQVDTEDDKIFDYTQKISNMLKKKHFNLNFGLPLNIDMNDAIKENESFSKGVFMHRVLEDMQYCPICEETKKEQLCAIHILPSYLCNHSELIDKNNGLIMCLKHANDYKNGLFYFDERGFIKKTKTNEIDDRVHLSLSIRNKIRTSFIKRYQQFIEQQAK